MTKPVTSVAAMILVEDGLLALDDELGSILPGFAGVQVYENGGTRPPSRPILVRDLLLHTSGLTYGFFGDSPVDSMYNRELNALPEGAGGNLEERIATIASLPLIDDPGARWNYSVSTDVLGRVVEVVSGQSLNDVLPRTHLRAAGHGRYRVSRSGRQARSLRGDVPPQRRRPQRRRGRPATAPSPVPRPGSPAAAAWCRRPATTSASAECCWARANSTA